MTKSPAKSTPREMRNFLVKSLMDKMDIGWNCLSNGPRGYIPPLLSKKKIIIFLSLIMFSINQYHRTDIAPNSFLHMLEPHNTTLATCWHGCWVSLSCWWVVHSTSPTSSSWRTCSSSSFRMACFSSMSLSRETRVSQSEEGHDSVV